jgi:hypothetical protein
MVKVDNDDSRTKLIESLEQKMKKRTEDKEREEYKARLDSAKMAAMTPTDLATYQGIDDENDTIHGNYIKMRIMAQEKINKYVEDFSVIIDSVGKAPGSISVGNLVSIKRFMDTFIPEKNATQKQIGQRTKIAKYVINAIISKFDSIKEKAIPIYDAHPNKVENALNGLAIATYVSGNHDTLEQYLTTAVVENILKYINTYTIFLKIVKPNSEEIFEEIEDFNKLIEKLAGIKDFEKIELFSEQQANPYLYFHEWSMSKLLSKNSMSPEEQDQIRFKINEKDKMKQFPDISLQFNTKNNGGGGLKSQKIWVNDMGDTRGSPDERELFDLTGGDITMYEVLKKKRRQALSELEKGEATFSRKSYGYTFKIGDLVKYSSTDANHADINDKYGIVTKLTNTYPTGLINWDNTATVVFLQFGWRHRTKREC